MLRRSACCARTAFKTKPSLYSGESSLEKMRAVNCIVSRDVSRRNSIFHRDVHNAQSRRPFRLSDGTAPVNFRLCYNRHDATVPRRIATRMRRGHRFLHTRDRRSRISYAEDNIYMVHGGACFHLSCAWRM